eukprot:GGOE01014192.1.p1 GENE.GGOE01014192.1~~GGOE01014192.1.p1  ORF type:complete len:508 (-),score=142.25 GGOE01014192.1:145-1668(-)
MGGCWLPWLLMVDLLWCSSSQTHLRLRRGRPPAAHVIQSDEEGAFVEFPRQLRSRKWQLQNQLPVTTINQYMLTMVEIQIGTPARTFDAVLDTGSSTLVVPSVLCTDPCSASRRYDGTISSTGHQVPCDACSCEHCSQSCSAQCQFSIQYADAAEASGGLWVDRVDVGGAMSANLTFLAFDHEVAFRNGHLTDEYLHGVLGLGPPQDYCSPPTAHCQPMTPLGALVAQNGLSNLFALHLGNGLDDDGTLIIGGDGSDSASSLYSGSVQWARLQTNHNYQVYLHSLNIEEMAVITDEAHVFGRTIIDSGTNMIVLADPVFEALQAMYQRLYSSLPAVATYKSIWNKTGCRGRSWNTHPHDDCKYCLYGSKVDITQYPDLVFILDDDVQITIGPTHYFYETLSSTTNDLLYCLGITSASNAGLSNKHTTVLGHLFLQGVFTVFDLDGHRVGFASVPEQATVTDSFSTIFSASGLAFLGLFAVFLFRRYRSHEQMLKERFELGLPTVRAF